MGVPYEVFWYEDVDMLDCYVEAHKERIDHSNWKMWIQGMYIHEAIGVVIHNAFKSKNDSPVNYPTEPYEFGVSKEDTVKKESERLYKQMKAVMTQFNNKDTQRKNLEMLNKLKKE